MFWRTATRDDDPYIEDLCLRLYEEDPGTFSMSRDCISRTLMAFRDNSVRGCAVIAMADNTIAGYALLVSFWSNEYGGEIVCIDELYVVEAYRNRGLATGLIQSLTRGDGPWPRKPVGLVLEVTPRNARARALYERLGFRPMRNDILRLLLDR